MNQNAATQSDLSQTDTSRATEGPLIESDRVEGTKVLDRSGKDIGTIKSLKIDKVSGRVAYAVAEFGGFFGIGGHEYTIPWSKLDYDPGAHGFRTDLTKEQLEGAPSSTRRSKDTYRASGGGVGTGRRPESDASSTADTSAARVGTTTDADTRNADDDWNRNRDREVYDYYAVAYYWEE